MKPCYLNDAGDVRVIRPFAYVRERQTAAYAESAGLPVIPDNCPACFGDGAERSHMKQILAQLEKDNTKLFPSLLRAMRPLMEETLQRSCLRLSAALTLAGLVNFTKRGARVGCPAYLSRLDCIALSSSSSRLAGAG